MARCGDPHVFYTFISYTHTELAVGSWLELDPMCE
jgi:hypothetical protein